MAVLPSPDAVGPIEDSPLRRMGIGVWNPSVIDRTGEQAGAQVERLGSEVGALGADLQRNQDNLDLSQAMGAAHSASIAAHANLPGITDSSQLTSPDGTAPAPFVQNYQNQIAAARAKISNPFIAQHFDAQTQPLMAQVGAAAMERGRQINNQNAIANSQTNIDSMVSNAATIDDETKSAAALQGVKDTIAPLIHSGAITPEEGVAYGRQAAAQYATARMDYLLSQAMQTRDYSRLEQFLGAQMSAWGPNAAGAVVPGQGVTASPLGPNNVYQNINDTDSQGRPGQVAKFLQWNPNPVGLDQQKLSEVHPDLQAVVNRARQDNPDLQFVVGLGKSTPEQEAQARQWGWSWTPHSQHLDGNAVDIWPIKDGKVDFNTDQQQQINAAMQKAAKEVGVSIQWHGLHNEGGVNQTDRDAPNFGLTNPRPLTAAEQTQQAAAWQKGRQLTTPVSFQTTGVNVPTAYAPMVNESAQRWGVDPALLSRQLWQESGYRDVKSSAGAEGIGQFIPGTAARYGVDVHDAKSSIDGAAHYMHDLQNMFGGNQGLALAGYNWGEDRVQKWLRNGADPTRVPAQTANYVKTITGHPLSEWVNNPGIPIHTTPLGPGQHPTPLPNWSLPPINNPTWAGNDNTPGNQVASIGPVGLPVAPAGPGPAIGLLGAGSTQEDVDTSVGTRAPPQSQWPQGAQNVVANADGSLSYRMGDGSFQPVPGSRATGTPHAQFPAPPQGSVLSMMRPEQRAQLQLRGIQEIMRMQREDAVSQQRDNRNDLASIRNSVKTMESGIPLGENAWAPIRNAYANSADPEVRYNYAVADAVRSNLMRYAQSSPSQVAADLSNLRAEYAQQINNPATAAQAGVLGAVIDSTQRYLHAYEQGVAKDPLGRAAMDGVIGSNGEIKALDPSSETFGQDVADRVTQAKAAAAMFGMNTPTYLRPEERVAMRNIAQQGGDQMVNLAKGIVQGGGSDAYEMFRQIGKEAPPLAQIGQWALDPNADHTSQIQRYAAMIAAMNDPQAKKNLPIVNQATLRASRMGDPLGDAYSGFSPDAAGRTRNTASILASESANAAHVDPKDVAQVANDPDLIPDAYHEAVGGTKDKNGNWYGGIAQVNGGFWSGRQSYNAVVPTNMRQDRFADVIGQIDEGDIRAMGPPPYQVGDSSYKPGIISADLIKRGKFTAVPDKATGMFAGRYRVELPDSQGRMQPVLNQNGQPWVFDMNRAQDHLSKAVDGAFMPQVAPSTPTIPMGAPRGGGRPAGRYQDVHGLPLAPDVASNAPPVPEEGEE